MDCEQRWRLPLTVSDLDSSSSSPSAATAPGLRLRTTDTAAANGTAITMPMAAPPETGDGDMDEQQPNFQIEASPLPQLPRSVCSPLAVSSAAFFQYALAAAAASAAAALSEDDGQKPCCSKSAEQLAADDEDDEDEDDEDDVAQPSPSWTSARAPANSPRRLAQLPKKKVFRLAEEAEGESEGDDEPFYEDDDEDDDLAGASLLRTLPSSIQDFEHQEIIMKLSRTGSSPHDLGACAGAGASSGAGPSRSQSAVLRDLNDDDKGMARGGEEAADEEDLEVQMINESFEEQQRQTELFVRNDIKDAFYMGDTVLHGRSSSTSTKSSKSTKLSEHRAIAALFEHDDDDNGDGDNDSDDFLPPLCSSAIERPHRLSMPTSEPEDSEPSKPTARKIFGPQPDLHNSAYDEADIRTPPAKYFVTAPSMPPAHFEPVLTPKTEQLVAASAARARRRLAPLDRPIPARPSLEATPVMLPALDEQIRDEEEEDVQPGSSSASMSPNPGPVYDADALGENDGDEEATPQADRRRAPRFYGVQGPSKAQAEDDADEDVGTELEEAERIVRGVVESLFGGGGGNGSSPSPSYGTSPIAMAAVTTPSAAVGRRDEGGGTPKGRKVAAVAPTRRIIDLAAMSDQSQAEKTDDMTSSKTADSGRETDESTAPNASTDEATTASGASADEATAPSTLTDESATPNTLTADSWEDYDADFEPPTIENQTALLAKLELDAKKPVVRSRIRMAQGTKPPAPATTTTTTLSSSNSSSTTLSGYSSSSMSASSSPSRTITAAAASSTPTSDTDLFNELAHVLEAFAIPASQRASLDEALADIGCGGEYTRVFLLPGTSAIIAFQSSQQAMEAQVMRRHRWLQLRSLFVASEPAKEFCRKNREQLRDVIRMVRPPKSMATARRLVEGALGLRSTVSREQRDKERAELQKAREAKKASDALWR